jgi:RNA polymerase sigma-70 factor (ECF subfamily)
MKLNQLSDEELMQMYQSGSEEAFKVFYQRHSEKIYGFLRGRVWNDERAAELFQDVFVKLHLSKHLYNKSLPALPWIFSITKSVLVDGLRVNKKAGRDSENTVEAAPAEGTRSISEVTGLLDKLPSTQRQALELRYVDEKTFEEIADTLETTSQNARKIVSRAIMKLKSFAREKGE